MSSVGIEPRPKETGASISCASARFRPDVARIGDDRKG